MRGRHDGSKNTKGWYDEEIPHNWGLGVSDCFSSQSPDMQRVLHEVVLSRGRDTSFAGDHAPRYWTSFLKKYNIK